MENSMDNMFDFIEFVQEVNDFVAGLRACEEAAGSFSNVRSKDVFFASIATIIDTWCDENDVGIEESNKQLEQIIVARRDKDSE